MKKLITIALICLSFASVRAESEKSVKTKIKDVTVFLSGAQVTRTGSATVDAGKYTLKLEGLSPDIEAQSIQVKGTGKVTILSVQHRPNYLKEAHKPNYIKRLEDSLKVFQRQQKYYAGLSDIYNNERALILANKSVKGDNTGLNSEDLEDVADFFRQRLAGILDKQLDISEKKAKIDKEVTKMQNQLNVRRGRWQRNTSEILIEVAAKARTTVKLQVSYMVRKAGWSPAYDVRATDINKPVTLNYKASVWQGSGVDWSHVNLVLSTGNPTQNGSKPEIRPWLLRFQQPVVYRNARMSAGSMAPESNRAYDFKKEAEEVNEAPPLETVAAYTTVSESQTNINFKIALPYDIASDNMPHTVQINDIELPATYTYYSAPKLEFAAFLLARITGWGQYQLLSGNCNVYFEGTYIGQSYLNTQDTDDTLNISLGRDKSVVVKRERIKDFTHTRVIGGSKKESLGLDITIRNNKSAAIDIIVEDQVPLSTDKSIEVEVLEQSNAVLDETTGKLKWVFKLEPGANRTMTFKYSVKYPKNKRINL